MLRFSSSSLDPLFKVAQVLLHCLPNSNPVLYKALLYAKEYLAQRSDTDYSGFTALSKRFSVLDAGEWF